MSTSTSTSTSGDAKSLEQDEATMTIGGIITSSSKIINGATEVLYLLKTLGDGYRLSCLYRCQVLHGDYRNKKNDCSEIAYNFL